MLREQLERIISGLKRLRLTEGEKQFTESVAQYYNQTGKLTEQQESISEGIYREKTRPPRKVRIA